MRRIVIALVLISAGCASSSGQTESDEPAESQQQTAERQTDTAAEAEKPEEPAEPDHPTVQMEELIGMDTSGGLPDGCPNDWQQLKGRKFPGKTYACDGFWAPERYREPTVVIGVDEDKVRRISLQAFYEAGDGVREAYNAITNDYQQRCDRQGGSGGQMVLQCPDFLVDIQMRRETGMISLVFGLENWDLPH